MVSFVESLKNNCGLCNKKNRIPFIYLFFGAFNIFTDNLKIFFKLASVYALITLVFSLVLGFSFVCNYHTNINGVYCSNSGINFAIFSVIKFVIFGVFISKWGDYILSKKEFNFKSLFSLGKKEVLSILGLVSFIVLNLVPFLSFYLLYISVPNPVWQIEVIYFGFVSIGFLVPIIFIRFYSLFAFVVMGEKLPSLKLLWQKTKHSGFKVISAVTITFILLLFLLMTYYGNFRTFDFSGFILQAYLVEYIYEILLLIFCTFFINNCYLQKSYLFERIENE